MIQLHTLYLVDYKETREEKEKAIEEKKFALVAKVIWGYAYSTGLIAHTQIEWTVKKKITLIGRNIYQRINRKEKKTTLSVITPLKKQSKIQLF